MQLLTKAIREALPPLYSQDGKGMDAIAHVKFFTPDGSWTWWASEASAICWWLMDTKEHQHDMSLKEAMDEGLFEIGDSGERHELLDVRFFGLVDGHERELGYFMLSELESARGPWGLKIERDRHWKPRPLKDCKGAQGA